MGLDTALAHLRTLRVGLSALQDAAKAGLSTLQWVGLDSAQAGLSTQPGRRVGLEEVEASLSPQLGLSPWVAPSSILGCHMPPTLATAPRCLPSRLCSHFPPLASILEHSWLPHTRLEHFWLPHASLELTHYLPLLKLMPSRPHSMSISPSLEQASPP